MMAGNRDEVEIFDSIAKYHLKVGKVIGFWLFLLSQLMMNIILLYATLRYEKVYVGVMTIVALLITLFPIEQLKKY